LKKNKIRAEIACVCKTKDLVFESNVSLFTDKVEDEIGVEKGYSA
jgi:hypothetical protein